MQTLPRWAHDQWAQEVAEPFRSDRRFWSSLAASTDALAGLIAAAAVAAVLVLIGDRDWFWVPFLVPIGLIVRAAVIGRGSSRRSRETFADRRAWRDAERAAVATAFFRVLCRTRLPAR